MANICFLTKKICNIEVKNLPNEYKVFVGYQVNSDYFRQVDLLACIQVAITIANQDLQKNDAKLILQRFGSNEGIHISCEICEFIKKSTICIFEISDKNPNVFFELGLASGKEIILLKHRQGPEVPADISGIKYTFYDGEEGLEGLQIVLAKKMFDLIIKKYKSLTLIAGGLK